MASMRAIAGVAAADACCVIAASEIMLPLRAVGLALADAAYQQPSKLPCRQGPTSSANWDRSSLIQEFNNTHTAPMVQQSVLTLCFIVLPQGVGLLRLLLHRNHCHWRLLMLVLVRPWKLWRCPSLHGTIVARVG